MIDLLIASKVEVDRCSLELGVQFPEIAKGKKEKNHGMRIFHPTRCNDSIILKSRVISSIIVTLQYKLTRPFSYTIFGEKGKRRITIRTANNIS